MAQQIHIDILVDGDFKVNPYSSLSIFQTINDHHSFEVKFSHEIKSGSDVIFISKFQSFLGKTISITLGHDLYGAKNQNEHLFKGIITDVQMNSDTYDPGSIILKGFGSTIALETIESCSTHLEKNLQQIVSKTISDVPSNILSVSNSPVFKKAIPYLVQYKESSFSFLKRIAHLYGEWLYYDGKELFFGKPQKFPLIELQYPENLSHLNFSIGVKPLNYTGKTFSLEKVDKKQEVDSSTLNIQGLGGYGKAALKGSEDVFSLKANAPTTRWSEKSEMEAEVLKKKGSLASDLIHLHADSDDSSVHVGTIVNIVKHGSSLGKYFVTEVLHQTDGNGNYSNSFKAIPSEVEYLPSPIFQKPFIDHQIGKVIDNKCPDGNGRVKVQLMWQPDEDKSSLPWIDVISPSAGKFTNNKKNRGFHFTPEVEDYVMVCFTDGDPSRPYVAGSISTYDSRNSSSNKDNFEKLISTRGGNTIYFRDNEDKGEQEIRLETDDKNFISIVLLKKAGTINLISSSTVNVKSEKINFEGKDITIKASNDLNLSAGNNFNLDVSKVAAMKANKELTLDSVGDIKATSSNKVALGGIDIELNGTKSVKASGVMAELSGSAMTTIKGALVKIN